MILLKPYENLNDVLKHLKIQVLDSLDFCAQWCPRYSHPRNLFNFLKQHTVYKNDPETIELLMSAQTLISGSHTGQPGAGDCDDFTILGLACLLTCGFSDNYIILAGHTRAQPVHIYIKTEYLGKIYTFDLTNRHFNQARHYKYTQTIKF